METWVSGPGLAADHFRVTAETITAAEIATRASLGDVSAQATLDRHASRLARGLAHVVNLIDPHVIVLGGGLSNMARLYQTLPSLMQRYVLADEMSFGLAPVIVRRLIPLIKRIADDGIGVLLIEQYTHLALAIADRIAVMVRGRIVVLEDAARFRDNPGAIRDLYLSVQSDPR